MGIKKTEIEFQVTLLILACFKTECARSGRNLERNCTDQRVYKGNYKTKTARKLVEPTDSITLFSLLSNNVTSIMTCTYTKKICEPFCFHNGAESLDSLNGVTDFSLIEKISPGGVGNSKDVNKFTSLVIMEQVRV